jgi:HlyD family secretion protein
MKTRNRIIAGAAVAAVVLAYVVRSRLGPETPVETAPVKTGSIREYVDEQAKTRLPQTYLITMPITGRIEAIKPVEGDAVKAGQLVAQIVPRDLKLAVDQARANVQRLEASIKENAYLKVEETAHKQSEHFVESTKAAVAAAAERVISGKAKLDYSKRDLARVRELAVTRAKTEEDLERAQLVEVQSDVDFKQDQLVHASMTAVGAATDLMPAMVLQYIQRKRLSGGVLKEEKAEAEARLQQVLQEQERGPMRSPVDGVVLDRLGANERYLSAGRTLLEIGRLEDMEVEADVLSLDVVAAKVGDRAEVYGPAIGKTPAKAVVSRIFPAGFTKVSSLGVEQQRVKVVLRFERGELDRLLKDRRLGAGYRVRVRIFTEDRAKAMLIPRSALFRAADNTWQVFVVRGGRARLQTVEVGLMNDEQVEIVQGLSENEPVVLTPESSLNDGDRVWVARQ